MTNNTYTPSVHLFVDMDGTLVTWKQAACFEELLQENYFRDLPPYKEVVDAINWLNSTYPEIDVHVLSAYMPENPYSVNEKNEWLDTYLPAIPKANRIFVPCGISKAEAAAKAIGESTMVLGEAILSVALLPIWKLPTISGSTSRKFLAQRITAGRSNVQAPPIGTLGTVYDVDDTGSLLVNWDNFSRP